MRDIFTAVVYRPKMGMMKARKLAGRSKIFLFSKTVQDYGNRSADICIVMPAVGQVGFYLSTDVGNTNCLNEKETLPHRSL